MDTDTTVVAEDEVGEPKKKRKKRWVWSLSKSISRLEFPGSDFLAPVRISRQKIENFFPTQQIFASSGDVSCLKISVTSIVGLATGAADIKIDTTTMAEDEVSEPKKNKKKKRRSRVTMTILWQLSFYKLFLCIFFYFLVFS